MAQPADARLPNNRLRRSCERHPGRNAEAVPHSARRPAAGLTLGGGTGAASEHDGAPKGAQLAVGQAQTAQELQPGPALRLWFKGHRHNAWQTTSEASLNSLSGMLRQASHRSSIGTAVQTGLDARLLTSCRD